MQISSFCFKKNNQKEHLESFLSFSLLLALEKSRNTFHMAQAPNFFFLIV